MSEPPEASPTRRVHTAPPPRVEGEQEVDVLSVATCGCRSIYCALDWATRCRIEWICDRHEAYITGTAQ